MNNIRKLTRMSFTLGFITLVGLIFALLALTDIYHNSEADLNLEWNVVRISILFALMYVAISSVTIFKLVKKP